jgi:hypothetical protein
VDHRLRAELRHRRATGILLAAAPEHYQYHNSYFLIAHFHQTLIGGVVYGMLAGMYYWWPKMFGFKLDERLGKIAFWLWNIGFYTCFMSQYALGFMGMQRRMYTYPATMGWNTLNLVSTIGAYIMGLAFLFIVAQVLYSIKHGERDLTGDPWDGRTLEWSLPSPAPHYNFAVIPTVTARDMWWVLKEEGRQEELRPRPEDIATIHLPKNTARPFLLGLSFFVAGMGLVFQWYPLVFIGFAGGLICLLLRALGSAHAKDCHAYRCFVYRHNDFSSTAGLPHSYHVDTVRCECRHGDDYREESACHGHTGARQRRDRPHLCGPDGSKPKQHGGAVQRQGPWQGRPIAMADGEHREQLVGKHEHEADPESINPEQRMTGHHRCGHGARG